jgi:hypothetical protein
MGIEPTAQAWEAWVLPLYDARYSSILVAFGWDRQIGAARQGPFSGADTRHCRPANPASAG